jgi:beta-galactosidase
MHVFSGMMTAIVSSSEEPGEIILEASSKGLKKGVIVIRTQRE